MLRAVATAITAGARDHPDDDTRLIPEIINHPAQTFRLTKMFPSEQDSHEGGTTQAPRKAGPNQIIYAPVSRTRSLIFSLLTKPESKSSLSIISPEPEKQTIAQ